MSKLRVMECEKCDKRTVHDYISSESPFMGRAFLAIVSLGISETQVKRYYKCQECGQLRDDTWP